MYIYYTTVFIFNHIVHSNPYLFDLKYINYIYIIKYYIIDISYYKYSIGIYSTIYTSDVTDTHI